MIERVDGSKSRSGGSGSLPPVARRGELAWHQIPSDLTRAFSDAALKGRSLADVLRSLALALRRTALEAALAPVTSVLGGARRIVRHRAEGALRQRRRDRLTGHLSLRRRAACRLARRGCGRKPFCRCRAGPTALQLVRQAARLGLCRHCDGGPRNRIAPEGQMALQPRQAEPLAAFHLPDGKGSSHSLSVPLPFARMARNASSSYRAAFLG